jgi:phospholipid transport system substrate-binding protein
MWNLRVKRAAWLGLAAWVMLTPLQAQASSPNDFVEEAVRLLADQLDGRREELAVDKKALYNMINEILLPRFDRRFAAGQVLARHWRGATPEQRDRFVTAFYTTLLHRYADGVLEFELSRVEVLPFRGDASKKITSVKTIVRLDDGTKVPVNYTLVNRDESWQMFDVTIEGVSYVRNFRAEFDAEIKAKGLAAVIERLEAEATGEGDG